jgi:ketosteroid isomerase-like protein
MSNADVINQAYADFGAGDVPAVLAAMAPDVEWVEPEGIAYAGTYVGPAAVAGEVFQRMGSEYSAYRIQPEQLLEHGDQVAVLGWYEGTYRETGRSFRARFVHWWTVAGDRITRFELVVDSATWNEPRVPA